MKKICFLFLIPFFFACNNSKKDKTAADNPQQPAKESTTDNGGDTPPITTSSGNNTTVTIEGKEMGFSGSILVDKDKNKLQPGAPYRCMLTTSSGSNNESLILKFLLDTKPGVYPVIGMSYSRGKDDNTESYGGLLGGDEKIRDGKVNLTECKDLGDNGAGGHKWSISGTVENLVIPAMGLMLMDESKKHPKEIKLDKITFSGLTFDDNAEEMLQKALEALDKMKQK